jgi:hypothetical protein
MTDIETKNRIYSLIRNVTRNAIFVAIDIAIMDEIRNATWNAIHVATNNATMDATHNALKSEMDKL